MISALETVLSEADVDVLVYQVDGEQQRSRFFHDLPARRKVDAVVLVALPVLMDEAERLDFMGAEVVVAGGRIRDYPHVEVDDHAIGRTAVQHLIDLGHRRIAMIRTSDTEGTYWSSDAARMQGFRDGMAAAGLRSTPPTSSSSPTPSSPGCARCADCWSWRRRPPVSSPTPTSSPSAHCAPCRRRGRRPRAGLAHRGRRPPHRAGVRHHQHRPVGGGPGPAGRPTGARPARAVRAGPRAIEVDFRLEMRDSTGPAPGRIAGVRDPGQRAAARHSAGAHPSYSSRRRSGLAPTAVVVLDEDVAVLPRHVVAVELPRVVGAPPGVVEVEADQQAALAAHRDVGRDDVDGAAGSLSVSTSPGCALGVGVLEERVARTGAAGLRNVSAKNGRPGTSRAAGRPGPRRSAPGRCCSRTGCGAPVGTSGPTTTSGTRLSESYGVPLPPLSWCCPRWKPLSAVRKT